MLFCPEVPHVNSPLCVITTLLSIVSAVSLLKSEAPCIPSTVSASNPEPEPSTDESHIVCALDQPESLVATLRASFVPANIGE